MTVTSMLHDRYVTAMRPSRARYVSVACPLRPRYVPVTCPSRTQRTGVFVEDFVPYRQLMLGIAEARPPAQPRAAACAAAGAAVHAADRSSLLGRCA